MPFVEMHGSPFFYAGEPDRTRTALIFCHGAGGSHRHWLCQVEGLKEQAATLAVDLPGHGASAGKPAREIALYREFLHDFSTAFGLDNFFLAGHSMGGAVALDYALHYGKSLKGLVLAGSGARLRVAPPILEACAGGNIPPGLIEFAYGPAASAALLESARQEVATVPPRTYFSDFVACNNFDCTERLAEIDLPVLLICGGADRMTPPKYSRYLSEQLPQSELVEVENAGHMVMLEKPARVSEAIASFLKKIGCA